MIATTQTIASDLHAEETLSAYARRTHPTPTRHPLRAALVAIALACVLSIGLAFAGSALASEGTWHANRVGLGDATTAPTYLVYLRPHGSVTYSVGSDGHNCPRGGFFTDVSAYAWNGTAIGAQFHTNDHDYWRGYRGRVSFDGITFHNGTHRKVLVAGWCD
jgi:hypothetical protein